jgi:hypothetical protein
MMPPTAGQTERFFLQRQQHRMPRTSSHHGIIPRPAAALERSTPTQKRNGQHATRAATAQVSVGARRRAVRVDAQKMGTGPDASIRTAPPPVVASNGTRCLRPSKANYTTQPAFQKEKKNTNAISPLIKRSSASPSRRRRSHSRSSSSLDASVPFSPPSSPVASSSPPAPALPKW